MDAHETPSSSSGDAEHAQWVSRMANTKLEPSETALGAFIRTDRLGMALHELYLEL
jgi:hypothetical protein